VGEECGFGEEETKSCKCRTIAVCCTVLQCVAVCSRVLQCVVESCKCRASGDGEEPTVVKVVAQLITEYLSSPCPPPSPTSLTRGGEGKRGRAEKGGGIFLLGPGGDV